MSFEVKENKLIIRGVHTLCECHQSYIISVYEEVFKDILMELWREIDDTEGEWSLDEDELYDLRHNQINEWVEESDGDRIIAEYGLNQAFKEFVDEYGFDCLNKENLSGQMAFYILNQQLRDVENQFWEDIAKATYSNDGLVVEFE